jgi:hypothetical protein
LDRDGVSIGAMADSSGRQFVLRALPDLGELEVDTPPLLVITPDGVVLDQIDNYSTEDIVFRSLQSVLKDNQQWNHAEDLDEARESASETGTIGSVITYAERIADVGEYDTAIEQYARLLLKAQGDESRISVLQRLLHISRLAGRSSVFEAANSELRHFGKCDSGSAIEVAHYYCGRRDYGRVLAGLGSISIDRATPRASEATYLRSVALFQTGEVEASKAALRDLILTMPEGPWSYRADWALFTIEHPGRRTFTTEDEPTCLGRVGYMGRLNPDFLGSGAEEK